MSDIELLQNVISTLDRIPVPAQYTEQIGIPIYNSSNLLKSLYNTVMKKIQENENVKEEPEIEFGELKEVEENENVEQGV